MSNKEYTAEGIVEYFEGLVEYMRKLGYEDPRDKRIAELESDKSTLQQSLSNACGRIEELEAAKELQYEIMELKNQEIEELEMLLNEYKDAECRAVKLHGEALTHIEELKHVLGAIENGIRFEWEDHTGEVSSGVEKLINNWKEKRDAG